MILVLPSCPPVTAFTEIIELVRNRDLLGIHIFAWGICVTHRVRAQTYDYIFTSPEARFLYYDHHYLIIHDPVAIGQFSIWL
jgi:hypothetical protein